MTPSERLSLAIHQESAAIAPRTSELIEAAKEVLRETEWLLAGLRRIRSLEQKNVPKYAQEIAAETLAVYQQTTLHSEEGK